MREMKDSGVEWIGEIPKDWNCMRLKFAFGNSNVGESVDKELYSSDENGYIFYTAGANPVKTSYTEFPMWKYTTDNDILLARNGTPYIYLPSKDAVYSDHIIRINIKDGYCRRFLRYCLQRSIESIIVDSVSIATWSISLWKEQKLPLPYYHEQKYLADYLDSKCSKIDVIIEKQQAIIEKLKEYKLSIINEAVTQGINPDVNMKQSGYKWIGSIPEHWNMVYAKQLFSQRKDRAFEDDEQLTASQKYGIISQKEFMDIEGRQVMQVLKGEEILKHVEKGDFVISMRSFQGGLEYSEVSGKISSAYVMLIPNRDKVCDRYYKWLFKSKKYISALQGTSNLIRDGQALRFSNFVQVYLPSLDLDEQKKIADYLDDVCPKIDNEIEKREKLLEKVLEYKKSLIYEVVTGKKEV